MSAASAACDGGSGEEPAVTGTADPAADDASPSTSEVVVDDNAPNEDETMLPGTAAESSDETTGAEAEISALPLTGFVDAFLAAGCEHVLGCRYGQDQDFRLVLGTEARCIHTLDSQFGARLRAFVDATQRGVFSYDEAAARRCLTYLAETCGVFEPEEPDDAFAYYCAEVFDGNVPEGGNCNDDVECQGDAYCGGELGGHCSDTCQPRLPAGAACDGDHRCSGSSSMGGICDPISNTCVELIPGEEAAVGEPCGVALGTAEAEVRGCEGSAECFIRHDERGHTCQTPIDVDAPCEGEGDVCVDGALCLPNEDGTLLCLQVAVQSDVGASCADRFDLCDPLSQLTCSDALTCQRTSDGEVGSACEMAGACSSGLVCSFVDDEPKCIAPVELGAGCRYGIECVSGQCFGDVCTSRFCAAEP